MNPEVTIEGKPLIFKDWIAAGITRIKDICYEVIPGYLPVLAIHDMLTGEDPRTISRTTEELRKLFVALPPEWSQKICTASVWPPPTLQPLFGIVNPSCGQTPIDLSLCRTRHFYTHLLQAEKPVILAVDYWIGVYATPNCHRCSATDTLEHAILDCLTVRNFWHELQSYVEKITERKLTLTTKIKLFGKPKTNNASLTPRSLGLVNWT